MVLINSEATEPNKERLRLWVKALRSGEYQQTKGVLCRIDDDGTARYCCLGVMCEVAIAGGLELAVGDPFHSGGTLRSYGGSEELPPDVVEEWFGLPTHMDVELLYREEETLATHMNDALGLDFLEIANAIEATFHLIEDQDLITESGDDAPADR